MESIKLTKEQIYKLSIMCFTLLPEYFNKYLLESRGESDETALKNYYLINGHGKIHYVNTNDKPDYSFNNTIIYNIKDNIHWLDFLLTVFQNKLYIIYDSHINGTGADYFIDLIESNGINSKLIDKMYEQFNEISEKTFNYYNLTKITREI